jgi:excisionase family DNA binding protein
MAESTNKQYLDKAAAGEYVGCSERFMSRLVDERRIRFYKVGKFVRFRIEDLDAFVVAGLVEPE